MRDALKEGLEFTAVVAATDMVAAGALTALRGAGPDVPGDVSPAGYDDIPFARGLHPALTTAHMPQPLPVVTAGGPSRAAAAAVRRTAVPCCGWASRRPGPLRAWTAES